MSVRFLYWTSHAWKPDRQKSWFLRDFAIEVINGIGPVFAGRLRAAGIETFAQLAELTPDRIREIIAPIRSSHMIDAEGWIAEARTLSERKT